MIGKRRRAKAEAARLLLERVGRLEEELRDRVRPALRELGDRPQLPVEEVHELRAALAGKMQRAIEHHTHPGGGRGDPFKPEAPKRPKLRSGSPT
jgi:hypothetical protein